MQVWINGEERVLAKGTTIAALLAALNLPMDGVAVALNLDVVPRGQHADRVIAAGDRVEIIRAVGGG
jgi:sulfur carrier protein